MSAADAVVAGAAAAGLCGTSGRLGERSAMKPEGQTECMLILSNMTASTPLNVGARAKLCARGKSREAKFYFLRLSCCAAIGDAALAALAPALRRRPALEHLSLTGNPFGDEGLAALVAPPPAGTPPLPAGGLKKLEVLDIRYSQITDAGCASLAAALNSGALPALKKLALTDIPASDAAKAAVYEARADLEAKSDDDADSSDDDAEEDVDSWDEDEGS